VNIMTSAPKWFSVIAVVALLWNLMGVLGVGADLSLSPTDVAALPADQQALHAARPGWSVFGSVLAVGAGTLGCIALLLRKRWALWAFVLSLVGVVLQDIGLLSALSLIGPVPLVLQAMVLLIALGLVALARRAIRNGWIS
jgi:hypothetical protein